MVLLGEKTGFKKSLLVNGPGEDKPEVCFLCEDTNSGLLLPPASGGRLSSLCQQPRAMEDHNLREREVGGPGLSPKNVKSQTCKKFGAKSKRELALPASGLCWKIVGKIKI